MPTEQEMIEQQKAQCVFCRIVKGLIPASVVYDDKDVIGILDINPASKGHVLILPKEHYPIMPMMPENVQRSVFKAIKIVSKAVKKATVTSSVSVFIANGGVAGQIAPHFMAHVIPREKDDNINLTPKAEEIKREDQEAAAQKITSYITSMSGGKVSRPNLAQVIQSNPQLKDAIINHTAEFKEMIKTNMQLKNLFEGVDIDKLAVELKKVEK